MKNYFLVSLLLVSLNAQAINFQITRKGLPLEQRSFNDQLLMAAAQGNLMVVQRALANGANINNKDASNNTFDTALHKAIDKNHNHVVRYLLSCKQLNINQQNRFGFTPLQAAVVGNNLSIAKLLLALGADASIKDTFNRDVFDVAKEIDTSGLVEEIDRTAILEVLNVYKEANENPSQETLDKAINLGLDFVVSKLLNIAPNDYKKYQEYAQATKKNYEQAKESKDELTMRACQIIGTMLREPMGLIGPDLYFSKTGLVAEDKLPRDVVDIIKVYLERHLPCTVPALPE